MALSSLTSSLCDSDTAVSTSGHMFVTIYAWVTAAAIAVILLLGFLHALLLRVRRDTYGKMGTEQQLVTITHSLFALVYAIQIVPYTYVVCRLLFGGPFLLELQQWYQGAFAILNSHLIMYAFEGALRLVVRRSFLLAMHHLSFLTLCAVGFFAQSFFVLKLGLILDLFATYEVALFATLAARRLGAPQRAVRALLVAGMLLYTVTRVLQLAALIPFFVGSYSQLAGCGGLGLWWGLLPLVCLLLAIQLYTFKIYAHVWRQHSPSTASLNEQLSSGDLGARGSRASLATGSSADKLSAESV